MADGGLGTKQDIALDIYNLYGYKRLMSKSPPPRKSLASQVIPLNHAVSSDRADGTGRFTPRAHAWADYDPYDRAFTEWLAHVEAGRIGADVNGPS
jgi:hypothetical protein